MTNAKTRKGNGKEVTRGPVKLTAGKEKRETKERLHQNLVEEEKSIGKIKFPPADRSVRLVLCVCIFLFKIHFSPV